MSCTIPKEALESFARAILPDIIAFYETEEGNRQYEEWLKTGEITASEKSEQKQRGSTIVWNPFVFSYKLIFLIEHKVLSKLNVVIALFHVAHLQ